MPRRSASYEQAIGITSLVVDGHDSPTLPDALNLVACSFTIRAIPLWTILDVVHVLFVSSLDFTFVQHRCVTSTPFQTRCIVVLVHSATHVPLVHLLATDVRHWGWPNADGSPSLKRERWSCVLMCPSRRFHVMASSLSVGVVVVMCGISIVSRYRRY